MQEVVAVRTGHCESEQESAFADSGRADQLHPGCRRQHLAEYKIGFRNIAREPIRTTENGRIDHPFWGGILSVARLLGRFE